MPRHYIDNIEYVKKELIGSGAFGEVYKAVEKKTNTTYALKEIKCKRNDDIDSALSEIRQLGTASHPNIVALVNVKTKQTVPFEATISLLIEYCPGGDLNCRLARPSSRKLNRQWMLEIANAVEHLHGRKIIHRDLKPQNILLTADEHVKVADFGLATRFCRKTEQQTWLNYYFDYGCGASCYIAPELIQEPIHYNYKVDIFAIGVIFYAILERTFLTVNGEKLYGIYTSTKENKRQPLGIHMVNIKRDVDIHFTERNTDLTNMIKEMLRYDYKIRPNIEAVKTVVERYQKWCILM